MEELTIRRSTYQEIAPLRERFRAEASVQIVRDSILRRGLADPHAIAVRGELVGYGGVWNEHFPGRLMEFFVLPAWRDRAPELCARLLRTSGATSIEAQTNLSLQHELLLQYTAERRVENLLFEEGADTALTCPGVEFRARRPDDEGPDGEWVVAIEGRVAAAGGLMRHYNPPYVDLYMAVLPEFRRRGLGSFLVQELRRIARAGGEIPAARCDPGNDASRRALERGGLRPCGTLLAGQVALPASPGTLTAR